jgi:trimeric autotransporter adhesin
VINGSGQIGAQTSSRRFKTDIHPLGSTLNGLMSLRPVSFRYKPWDVQGSNPLQFGLIAEEVAKVYPNLVVYGKQGKPFAVDYQELPALLLAELQRQQHEINAQRREIAQLRQTRARFAHQQSEIDRLMAHAGLR